MNDADHAALTVADWRAEARADESTTSCASAKNLRRRRYGLQDERFCPCGELLNLRRSDDG
jgi:hypothetical protein